MKLTKKIVVAAIASVSILSSILPAVAQSSQAQTYPKLSEQEVLWVYSKQQASTIKRKFEKTYVLYVLAKYKAINLATLQYLDKNYDDIYNVLLSNDYIRGTKYYDLMIRAKRGAAFFLQNRKTIAQLHSMSIDQEYYSNTLAQRNTQEGLSWIPKEFTTDPNFNFMIEGIKNDKRTINTAKELANKLGIEYELTLAGILTEQVRYALTERGEMKKFVSGIPMLLHLTKFSYGIGGIKSFTASKIRDDAKRYGYGEELQTHKGISDEGQWKNILIDKYWQVAYPSYLIKNILTRWNEEGYPLNKKPGVVITLYNFGNTENKKPHPAPQVGGAEININKRTYNFGGLGEMFYWWMKIEKPFN